MEERIGMLESEFQKTKEELRPILMEIYIFLMEAQSPLRAYPNALLRKRHNQTDLPKKGETDG